MSVLDDDDALVQAAFKDLKRDDGDALPPFATVVTRAQPRRARFLSSPVVRLAAAGVVLVAAAVTYATVAARERQLIVPPDVVALAAWRPATDALLPAPETLLGADFTLDGSILDFTPPRTRGQVP